MTDPVGIVRSELAAIADEWAAALVSNDPGRIGVFMDDAWSIVSESGIVRRDEFLSLIASGDLTHASMEQVGDADVRVFGETAVVVLRLTSTAHFQGRRHDADEWTTDVFMDGDGGWKCVHTHITPAESDWVPDMD